MASADVEQTRAIPKKYHMGSFLQPSIPPPDRQELPHSELRLDAPDEGRIANKFGGVVLEFVNGGALQLASEDRANQTQVFKSEWRSVCTDCVSCIDNVQDSRTRTMRGQPEPSRRTREGLLAQNAAAACRCDVDNLINLGPCNLGVDVFLRRLEIPRSAAFLADWICTEYRSQFGVVGSLAVYEVLHDIPFPSTSISAKNSCPLGSGP